MSNPMIVKRVPVYLDKPRHLVFDLNALAAMEDHYPTSEDAFTAIQDGSFKAVRVVTWAGLQREAEDNAEELTLLDVGRIIQMNDIPRLSTALLVALQESAPEQGEATPAKKPAAKKARTGQAPTT